jgi:hypothetical protein
MLCLDGFRVLSGLGRGALQIPLCGRAASRSCAQVSRRVEQIARKHDIVLRSQRNYHGWIFRSLALADSGRVGQREFVELAEAIHDIAPVEIDHQRACFHVDPSDDTKIATKHIPQKAK